MLRLHRYSIHTERSYVAWIVRDVRFHRLRSRDDLFPPEPTIEAFLTDLAVHGNVAAATQHHAMRAQVFLDTRVLNQAVEGRINAVRANKKLNVPVVMTLRDSTAPLVATRLYGSGLRLMGAVRLRVQDLDAQMTQLTGRSGQAKKDRCTTVPAPLTPLRQNHLAGVKPRHLQALAQGRGEVYLPHPLDRKYPHVPKEWAWPYVFPARALAVAPRIGVTRRHRVDPSGLHQPLEGAVHRAGLPQPSSAHTARDSCATHRRRRGPDIRTMQPRRGPDDRATTLIGTPLLQPGGHGVPSPRTTSVFGSDSVSSVFQNKDTF